MGRATIALDGQKFGMLTVIERQGMSGRNAAWLCLCDCGNSKVASSRNLRCGDTRSCGCMGLGKASRLPPSGRVRRDKPAHPKTAPPPTVLPCYTCSRWKPMEESDLGGYCEGGVFLKSKPHLGHCSYKA
jgi:hypothetical protein